MADKINNLYLCAGGSMAILLEKVDLYTILLVWRWWSDITIQCLHTTAKSFIARLSVRVLQHGDYTLIQSMHAGF